MKKTICVIGKGHSGTGFFTEHFHKSGVFVGENDNLNKHFDKAPYDAIYEIMSYPVGYEYENRLDHIPQFVEMAKPVINRYGHTNKDPNTEWDFTKMIKDEIPSKVINNMTKYLKDLDEHDGELVGWKLTESNLIYPWLVRLYPEWYYVHIVRDVRDILSRQEMTDTATHTDTFNIQGYASHPQKNHIPRRHIIQAINWKYQLDIVKSINAPNYIRITLEDFVMNQDRILDKLSDFVGFKVAKVEAKKEVVESWKERDHDPPVAKEYKNTNYSGHWNSQLNSKMNWNDGHEGFSYSFLNDYMKEFKYPDWPKYGDNKKYRRKE